jgi:hypothetical protein
MWEERKKSGKMVCWLYLKAKNAEYKITIAKKKTIVRVKSRGI